MPRARHGGPRQGDIGSAYGNRTDLNTALPITVAPGQAYGERAAQQAAQGAVPMGSSPNAAPPSPTVNAVPVNPAVAAAANPVPAPVTVAKPVPAPGTMPWTGPTNRPNEPVTAGLPFGPGPGPATPTAPPLVSDTLDQYAKSPNVSPSVGAMATVARSLGI